jgi:hypothetical protein
MKAGKLAIRPWLSCPHNEHRLVDLPSSVLQRMKDLEGPMTWMHIRSKQRTDQRVLVLTLKFLALKKTGFSPVKNTSQNFFDFCLPLF